MARTYLPGTRNTHTLSRWLVAASLLAGVATVLPGQSVSLERVRIIDGVSPESAAQVQVSQNGAVALAQVAGVQVRVVTADARRVAVLSAGPGTFSQVNWYGWVGASDSLWVADLGQRMVWIYSPDLKVARSFPLPAGLRGSLPWQGGRAPPILKTVLGDGHLVLEGKQALPPDVGKLHRSFPVLTRESGEVVSLLPRLDVPAGLSCERETTWERQRVFVLDLFCNLMLVPAVSAVTGHMTALPDGEDGSPLTRVVQVDIRGDTVLDRAVPIPRHRVTAAEIDSAATALALDPPPGSHPALERMVDSLRRAHAPAWWPAVQKIVAGLDGTIWLRLRDQDSAEAWLVLDASGAVLFPVHLSPRARLFAATREMIWIYEPGDSGRVVAQYRMNPVQ